MHNPTFSILISTKNRIKDLAFTLSKIDYLIQSESVECVVFDDGSTDGTYDFVQANFPLIQIQRNETSKGYIFCRNKMLNETNAKYAISLDDDAHFLTKHPLENLLNHFENHQECGLIALRIFWGLKAPINTNSNEKTYRVQSYVGCGHVWRMAAWRSIPNYPEWFIFYGEEEFAAYQLFIKNWQIHYFPEVLVHHRVDIKARRNNSDYVIRLRRSLCSGWFLFFLFLPLRKIPRKMAYSIWMQIKLKVFKGDFQAFKSIIFGFI